MRTMETNDTCKLLYNTERVTLHIPEYGRNVQKMVAYLKTIEDREKRNEQARAIIKVMEILNPSVHLQEDSPEADQASPVVHLQEAATAEVHQVAPPATAEDLQEVTEDRHKDIRP